MTALCAMQDATDVWERAGSDARLPPELVAHSETCASCAQRVSEVIELRRLAADLPEHSLEMERADEISFVLQAAARRTRSAQRVAAGPKQRRPSDSWAAGERVVGLRLRAWLAAALLAVGSLLVLAITKLSEPRVGAGSELAEIVLRDGAAGGLIQSGPREVYGLERGWAHFHVRRLGSAEGFSVSVGPDNVDVRGTQFDVLADAAGLQEVVVREGEVIVRLSGKRVATARAGQTWKRDTGLEQQTASAAPKASSLARTPVPPAALAVAAPPASAVRAAESSRARKPGTRDPDPVPDTRSARPVAPSTSAATPAASKSNGFDVAFRSTRQLLQTGQASQAAAIFDELAGQPDLDGGRRADVLYWAALAYQQAGDSARARARAERVVRSAPGAWYAARSALLIGEELSRIGQTAAARRWLERAAQTGRADVQRRAAVLLGTPEAKDDDARSSDERLDVDGRAAESERLNP